MSALAKEQLHTISDIERLSEGERAELIDGLLYDMAAPSVIHQQLVMQISGEINNHIRRNKGTCQVFPAPFVVYPFGMEDVYNYLEPDITLVCDPDKLKNQKGCSGSPDWIIEIVSPSSIEHDYYRKLLLYQAAGVREYWIVNPMEEKVSVYVFAPHSSYKLYTFQETIPVSVFPDFHLNIRELLPAV